MEVVWHQTMSMQGEKKNSKIGIDAASRQIGEVMKQNFV
jgi:hypothetical protein